MPDVWLWVPAAGDPRWHSVQSWIHTQVPEGYGLVFERTNADADGIDGAWNRLVEKFLNSNGEFLFSCHNDITYLPDTLTRLMSWGKPLVSALHSHRHPPFGPYVYRGEVKDKPHHYVIQFDETRQWLMDHPKLFTLGAALLDPAPEDALTPVDFTATGCCLIHRKVLEAMHPPWFHYEYPKGGEDRRFFEAAKAAGFQAYVDRSVVAGHGDPPVAAVHWLAMDKISHYVSDEDGSTSKDEA